MKTTYTLYAITWLVPSVLIALYLAGIIPTATPMLDELATYLLNLATITLSLITAYLAMKMFALPMVKRKMQSLQGIQKEKYHDSLSQLRIVAVLLVILINFLAFYITASQSPLYLSAMLGIALIFCLPQRQKN